MPRSTIAAVGSNARCGSAVLISNERSTRASRWPSPGRRNRVPPSRRRRRPRWRARLPLRLHRSRLPEIRSSHDPPLPSFEDRPYCDVRSFWGQRAAGAAGVAPCSWSQHAAVRPSATGDQRRLFGRAAVEGVGAARVEAAARRRVRRIRAPLPAEPRAGSRSPSGMRHGGDQRLRVRVQRQLTRRCVGACLHHDAEVHHGDDVGDVADDREVVGDQQQAEREVAREVDEQVRDLCLGGCVERGERLVEDEHGRVGGERARDRDPLPLAAAELVRVAAAAAAGRPTSSSSSSREPPSFCG